MQNIDNSQQLPLGSTMGPQQPSTTTTSRDPRTVPCVPTGGVAMQRGNGSNTTTTNGSSTYTSKNSPARFTGTSSINESSSSHVPGVQDSSHNSAHQQNSIPSSLIAAPTYTNYSNPPPPYQASYPRYWATSQQTTLTDKTPLLIAYSSTRQIKMKALLGWIPADLENLATRYTHDQEVEVSDDVEVFAEANIFDQDWDLAVPNEGAVHSTQQRAHICQHLARRNLMRERVNGKVNDMDLSSLLT